MFGPSKKDLLRRIEAIEKRAAGPGAVVVDKTLREAFDAFFDEVAKDLGYEARKVWFTQPWAIPFECVASPRQLATTTPDPVKIIRKPTARCKK